LVAREAEFGAAKNCLYVADMAGRVSFAR
jgi:hypothetical protein